MKERAVLLLSLSILLATGIAISNVRPAHAAPAIGVNLDATSSSLTDFTVEASASDAHTFRVGAVINSSSTNPVLDVQGWQLTINYNATAFVPRGDPDPAATPGNTLGLYVDGAANTVFFGANPNLVSSTATTSWNALLTSAAAFRVVTMSTAGSSGSITIAYTILGMGTSVKINGPNLLANVAFELVTKPSTPQSFTLANVEFVDHTGAFISTVSGGTGASETITNDPPHAQFSATPAPSIGPLAFSFDATASSDSDDTIANPGGYFWDFGDGNQTTASVPTLSHVFSAIANYSITLRVVDSQGATGSARDSLGAVIQSGAAPSSCNTECSTNPQPSHLSATVNAKPSYPFFTVTSNPNSLGFLPGDQPSTTITLKSFNQFSGRLNLTATVTPNLSNQPTASLAKSYVTLTSGGTNSSGLNIVVPATASLVEYNVTVIANGVSISGNVTVPLFPTILRVQPSPILNVPSGSFSVNVVASAAQVFGWQFTLNYNPAILSTSLSSISYGSFWQSLLAQGRAFVIPQVNQTRGTVEIAMALFGSTPPFTGNQSFASITFTIIGNGVSGLRLNNTFLVDPQQRSIPFIQENGVFCNASSCLDHDVAITSVTAKPATATIGNNVTITAIVANVGLNPENMTVTISAGGNTISQKQILLNPGDSLNITVTWVTTGVAAGSYPVKAEVALIGNQDGNPTNNAMTGNSVVLNATQVPSPFPFLLVYVSGGAAAAAAVAAFLFIRRRRRLTIRINIEWPPSGQGLNEILGKWRST